MSNPQSVKAVAKYIRMSPHKIRRVLDQIRGRSYQALMILEFYLMMLVGLSGK
jgi:large subunit ribosomal protein L22